MKNYALYVLIILIGSCVEPIEFESSGKPAMFVDAKVTNVVGASYVKINVDSGGDRDNMVPQDYFDVRIITSSGEEFSFIYSRQDRAYLAPSNFQGEVGKAYQLHAIPEGGSYQLRSNIDSIYSPVDFDLTVEDTLYEASSELTPDLLATRRAKAVVANLTPDRESFHTRFRYKSSFIHHFTREEIDRSESDYLYLFSCNGDDCKITYNETIILENDIEWYFRSPDEACFLADPCPVPACCIFFEDYQTKSEVIMEVMSPETYRFWEEVEKLRSSDGLVFDIFPYQLVGNVSCENCSFPIFGQFSAVFQTSKDINIVL